MNLVSSRFIVNASSKFPGCAEVKLPTRGVVIDRSSIFGGRWRRRGNGAAFGS
jgi:hypothetical protein